MKEIERRYLVRREMLPSLRDPTRLLQGYLSTGNGPASVRVRLKGRWDSGRSSSLEFYQGWLAVKGPGTIERDEFQYQVPVRDAQEMMGLCVSRLEKDRYVVPHAGRYWEVDLFHGAHSPLILAEVEIPDVGAEIALPPWAGPEVTEDPEYANGALAAAGRIPGSWYRLI